MTTNAQRAFWARKTLEEFAILSGDPVENEAQQMQRLMSALIHYCRLDKGYDAPFVINIINGSFMVNLHDLAKSQTESKEAERAEYDKLVQEDGKIDVASIPDSLRKFMPQK